MNERGLDLLEQYELECTLTRKGRGAILCETNRGLKLFRECSQSEERVGKEAWVLGALYEKGFFVDRYVKTRDGELIAKNESGDRGTLKDWYGGRECDVKSIPDILRGTAMLANIHKALGSLSVSEAAGGFHREDLLGEMEKHTRELKRARHFIRSSRKKSGFELLVMKNFDQVFQEASQVLEEMEKEPFQIPYQLRHGDYTYHNLLIENGKMAVTNFGHLCMGFQVRDLYHFMRKVMEKQNFNVPLGNQMLELYQQIRPLTGEEMRCLYLLFSYPEKFWKQMNYYFNSNKAWIPERNVEKLKNIEKQTPCRRNFLQQVFQNQKK